MLEFTPSRPLSLGAELELQLIDPETFDLTPKALELLGQLGDHPKIKPELFQGMLEINTSICASAHEIEKDLRGTSKDLRKVAKKIGVRLASVGTHPFAVYTERKIFPSARYENLIDRNQWIARRLVIFSLHIHLGMRSGNHCIQMTNRFLQVLHILLALSASSPYWEGNDTGLASSRITFFESLPTAGHPNIFRNWHEFEDFFARNKKSGGISSVKDIWWDLRPSPGYGTLEIRICDGLATLEDAAAIVALAHSLSTRFDDEIQFGKDFEIPSIWVVRENKWRSSRHGLGARVITDESGETVSIKTQIEELLEELKPLEKKYRYQTYFSRLKSMLKKGISADHQRALFSKTHSLKRISQANCESFES